MGWVLKLYGDDDGEAVAAADAARAIAPTARGVLHVDGSDPVSFNPPEPFEVSDEAKEAWEAADKARIAREHAEMIANRAERFEEVGLPAP